MKSVRFFALLLIFSLFSLLFASCEKEYGELMETKNDGELSFDLYGKDGHILFIEVKKGGEQVCEISCNALDLKTIDLNFDGNKDIMLSSSEKGEGYYQCFIYQPSASSFTENTTLGSMLNPTPDYERKLISCEIKSKETVTHLPSPTYKYTQGSALWYWKNGVLTQLSEQGIEYFTDGELYCVYSAGETEGSFSRNDSEDRWFFSYEELINAGYVWKK